jgi:hypothetical protein
VASFIHRGWTLGLHKQLPGRRLGVLALHILSFREILTAVVGHRRNRRICGCAVPMKVANNLYIGFGGPDGGRSMKMSLPHNAPRSSSTLGHDVAAQMRILIWDPPVRTEWFCFPFYMPVAFCWNATGCLAKLAANDWESVCTRVV